MANTNWLTVERRDAALIVSLPHSGSEIPERYAGGFVAIERARRDADWWLDRLYGFSRDLGATVVQTAISRSVIDVNRDPSGASLYPGQATTELCPTTTFDGEPLYGDGLAPDAGEIAERRRAYWEPYHAALGAELDRLGARHRRVVLYDCHSIRSVVPRLFDGVLPHVNIGTNDGRSCDPALTEAVAAVFAATGFSRVTNGRFKGAGSPAPSARRRAMSMPSRSSLPAAATCASRPVRGR